MNITLSADAELIRRARETAVRQGTSLNNLVRDFLRRLVGDVRGAGPAAELFTVMDECPGHVDGKRLSREELHER